MAANGKVVLALARAIEATFHSSEWTALGYLTETNDLIDRHPRLLRSLNWGDSDYKGHVLDMVAAILDRAPGNLRTLIEYAPIRTWLAEHDAATLEALTAEAGGVHVEHYVPESTTDTALRALTDAHALIREGNPSNAVDRVHTGLHAFLKAACNQEQIAFETDATANRLLKLLLDQHPKLEDLGPRSDDIKRVIKTCGAIVDALGTLRNHASLAHPTEQVLGNPEATVVVNAARTVLRYLDEKLSGR